MEKRIRQYIGIAFVFIIAISILAIILNWDIAFTQTVEVIYPDGCQEKFVNSKLVTEECVEGRVLEKQEADGVGQWKLGDI